MSQQELVEIVIDSDKFEPRYEEMVESSQYGSRKVRRVILTNNSRKLIATNKVITRMCQFLGIKRRQFNKQIRENGSVSATNLLRDNWKSVGLDKYKLLLKGDTILRITSIEYVGVPHSFVQQEIEDRLKEENIKFTKHTKSDGAIGFYALQNMQSKVDGIVPTIHYFNKNSGDRSLKFNAGGMVLVCSNGMTVDKGGIKIRIIHRMELSEIKTKINSILGRLLEMVEEIPKQFDFLRQHKLTIEEAKKQIDEELAIPKYLKSAVKLELDKNFDGSLWSVYMATTYIGTHLTTVPKRKRTIDISEEQSVRLQSIELMTPLLKVSQK